MTHEVLNYLATIKCVLNWLILVYTIKHYIFTVNTQKHRIYVKISKVLNNFFEVYTKKLGK